MADSPGGVWGMLAVTTDPINPTSIAAAFIAVLGTIYAARKSSEAQKESAAAQIDATHLAREAAAWDRANATIERLEGEAETARRRAQDAEERAEVLATLHRRNEEGLHKQLDNLRVDNRRLRVDLAAMVAIVRDEIAREAVREAYPELEELLTERRHPDAE